jgi:hypothetical protein
MFGRGPFSNTSFAGDPESPGDGPAALSGRALLTAVAVTTLEAVLAEQPAALVFAAEIHPWVLSGRG